MAGVTVLARESLGKEQMVELIPVDGIRLSRELCQLDLGPGAGSSAALDALLGALKAHKINVPFLAHLGEGSAVTTSCGIEAEHGDQVLEILRAEPTLLAGCTLRSGVGSLTVFPHRSSLTLLAVILGIFERYEHPIYALSSSLSALTFNTDFQLLDQIVEELLTVVELPPNHAPLRVELRVKQL